MNAQAQFLALVEAGMKARGLQGFAVMDESPKNPEVAFNIEGGFNCFLSFDREMFENETPEFLAEKAVERFVAWHEKLQ